MELNVPQVVTEERSFLTQVFAWMGLGLAVTGGVAAFVASDPALVQIFQVNRVVFYGIAIVEFILVFKFSGIVASTTSAAMATVMFLTFATLNGLTLACIFLLYTQSSIATAFIATAGTFGIMSLYGYISKTDLTKMGNLCFMGLIGIIIASVANMWFHNPTIMWITTYASVFIFVGLTAYDTQKIKGMFHGEAHSEEEGKAAISGALMLYLDFVNLFLSVLRVMGRRRN